MTFGQYLGLFVAVISIAEFAKGVRVLREATTPWHWNQSEYQPGQYFVRGAVFLVTSILLLAGVH